VSHHHHAWRAHFFDDVSKACAAMVQLAPALGQHEFWVALEHLGGAMGAPAPDATAFPHRKGQVRGGDVTAVAGSEPTEALAVQEAMHEAFVPHSIGTYVNCLTEAQGPAAVEAAYGVNLPRLREFKNRFDPQRRFGFALR
jgi:Berberine and berberine like